VHGDAKVGGDLRQAAAHIRCGAIPELTAVPEPSGESLSDQEASGPLSGADGGRLIEKRPRVEYLQELWVAMADRFAVCRT
jgi:hypothetical protein